MMIGPMKKKVVTSVIVTFVIMLVIFGVIAFVGVGSFNKQIADLKVKSETVQRYVFTKDLAVGDKIVKEDIQIVEVKNLSAPEDSYSITDEAKVVGKILCTNVSARAIVSSKMFYEDEEPAFTERLQEFNMIALPSNLKENDYIDIRVLFPTGEDYSVLVAKKVERYSNDSIFLKLSEDEILRVESAIIEAYMLDGSKIYANRYVNPQGQIYTYTEKVNYVARFKNYVGRLLSITDWNAEFTEEQIVALKNVDVSDVANNIDLNIEKVKEIIGAIVIPNEEVIAKYSDVEVKQKSTMTATYPVKTNVLAVIKSNPNIVEDVKANYSTATLVAQRMQMTDTTLDMTIDDPRLKSIEAKITLEVQTQKEERRAYLESLLANK